MGRPSSRSRSRSSSVATTMVSSCIDSSPSSAESSFRELDDAFIQTQTRIWLGEVLKIRLDEQLSIADLLADGELLNVFELVNRCQHPCAKVSPVDVSELVPEVNKSFEASKTVWNMLLEKSVELRQIKAYQCPLGSRKRSGRYIPYSNVDAFLKVCKILGLNSIDLFSPSDVVEKRDIRKVCICIRALSKKARSKQLNVPDFDLVTYTVVMPTDMVGCIRRSLESSQCSVSSSSSFHFYKGTRSKSQQKNLVPVCSGNYESCSEDSDEAENAYFGIDSHSSSIYKFDYPPTLNSDTENSPGAFSAVKPCTARQAALRSDMRNLYGNGLGTHCSSYHSRNGHQADNMSTCHFKAHGGLDNRALHTSNELRQSYGNASEIADIDLGLGNYVSEMGDSLCDNVAERDFIADYLAFSDSVVFRNDGNSPDFLEGEYFCNFFTSIDSHGLDSKQRTFQNGFPQRSSDDMEDVEVSSMTSMSSIVGRVVNMEFDDQYNAGDSSIMELQAIGFPGNETDNRDNGSPMEDQTQDSAQYEILSDCSTTDVKESQCKMKLEQDGFCTDFLSTCKGSGQPCTTVSEKFEIYGDSQIQPGKNSRVRGAESADVSHAEDDKENFRSKYLEKAVIGMSETNSHLEQGKNHCSLDSLHHKIFQEAKVPWSKCQIKENESHFCSVQYHDVVVEDVICEGSHDQLEGTLFDHNFASLANECEPMAEKHPYSSAKNSLDRAGIQASAGDESIRHYPEDRNEDRGNRSNPGISAENLFVGKKDRGGDLQEDRLPKRSLLKTFVKGTTLVGLLFLVLRVSGKKEADKSQEPLKPERFGGAKSRSQKERIIKPQGTYPAEKLKFGN